MQELYNIVVLISGKGTNLQALIDASHRSSYTISAVISNKAKAIGLNRAKISGIDTHVIEQESFNSKLEFEKSLATRISEINPKLIVLAGFMKVLSPQFVKLFRGKVINIHPSLLPKYGGRGMYGDNVHKAVLKSGDTETGITIHFVNENYDEGEIITQKKCLVCANETVSSLKEKIRTLELEHFPRSIEKIILR